MREVPSAMHDIWTSGFFAGDQRSRARVTIQKPHLFVAHVGDHWRYASWVMPQLRQPKELPNVKSVTWDRDPTNGTGSATITFYNTKALPLGHPPMLDGRLDRAGWYTYNRGHSSYSDRWGHTHNEWQGYLVYDRIIRTYEGYGLDPDSPPELDANLKLTGTWTIDDVDYDSRPGLIVVTARDGAGPLTEDVAFPPVVPLRHYPLRFDAKRTVPGPDHISISDSGWHSPTYRTDSGEAGGYTAHGASLYGHQPQDAFDADPSTYWLSIGNAEPSADYSYEWVEGKISGTITGVRIHVWGGPYRAYISVYSGGAWQGRGKIPYNNDGSPGVNGADIRFVKSVHIDHGDTVDVQLPHKITGAGRLRITLTHLTDSGIGTFPYRAGIREVKYTGTTITKAATTKTFGNYSDYTDIVKLFCALGGFWWPRAATHDRIMRSDGVADSYPCPSDDAALPVAHGRVWGDFENTGTTGVIVDGNLAAGRLTVDLFDKKPLLDCINYIRDIVGFIFMVDETGGAIFRSPNIWQVGNVIGDLAHDSGRTSDYITIDERNTLIGLTAKISGLNVREHIFVGNVNGRVGAAARGHNPYPTGRRRTAGWTDQHFSHKRDCQIMADLIGLRQYMTMRADTITIAGYPAIQVDDQVRIIEEVTGEGYLHYVQAIHSENDLESGKWTYQLTTNWLGEHPSDLWLWAASDFSAETYSFLHAMGKV